MRLTRFTPGEGTNGAVIRLAVLLVLLWTLLTPATGSLAQEAPPLRAAVIVSDLGPGAPRGRLERRVAEAWSARLRGTGGIFGRGLELTVATDASDPNRSARLAREAIEDGAHALVCCTTPPGTRRVAPLAAAAGVPLLSPAGRGEDDAAGWQFALTASDRTHLQALIRDVYRRGISGIGLMTPEGAFGDAAEEALRQFIAVESLRVIATARYPLDADVLTPEALQVATKEPGAVVAWGLRSDTVLAVEGLTSRGWTGPVYVRGALADPLAGGLPAGLSGDVRWGVAPAVVPDAIDPADPRSSWIADARDLGGGTVGSGPHTADGAIMHDALVLLGLAFERASMYGVSPTEVARYRLALRDALVSLGPVHLAAGSYDPSMSRPEAALAEGLIMARWTGGRLVALP